MNSDSVTVASVQGCYELLWRCDSSSESHLCALSIVSYPSLYDYLPICPWMLQKNDCIDGGFVSCLSLHQYFSLLYSLKFVFGPLELQQVNLALSNLDLIFFNVSGLDSQHFTCFLPTIGSFGYSLYITTSEKLAPQGYKLDFAV